MQTLEKAQELVRSRCKAVPPLKFKRLNDYSLQSECGQFFVSKSIVNDISQYSVWFKAPGRSAMQLRMNLPSGDEAKKWASSIANAYRKGTLSLNAPPTREELQRLKESTGGN